MAAQNRVTPRSEIVAIEQRGSFMGNRGCLHEGPEIRRRWNGRRWIICETSFQERRVAQWAPGLYTPLFFWDEAVALAAGHRPCAECRRPRYNAFRDAWADALGARPGADELDAVLHRDRLDGKEQRLHDRPWTGLPDGTFVLVEETGALVAGGGLHRWGEGGYEEIGAVPAEGSVTVITPAATVAVLAHGYLPAMVI